MKVFRVIPWLLILGIVSCGEDEDLGPVNGQLIIDGESFNLTQSTLNDLEDIDDIFQIQLYATGTVVNLDQFDRPNIVSRADVEGADLSIWGINSPSNSSLSLGEYARNFRSINDFEFSEAEILILRNASGGAGNIVAYEFVSGTFTVQSQTADQISLSWDMIFVNDDDPDDVVAVTGDYSGMFIYSQF